MELNDLSIFNIRDLGGIKVSDGRVIKPHLFIRSGYLINVKESDKLYLDSLNIKHVIDLRSIDEVENKKDNYLPLGATIDNISAITKEMYYDISLDMQNIKSEGEERLDNIYPRVAFGSPAYKKVMEYIKNEEVPILFHCAAGKDRTGILSAIILLLLGADEKTIIEDYMASLDKLVIGYGRSDVPHSWLVDEKWIKMTLNSIKERYENINDYFKDEFDIDISLRKKLQDKYLMETYYEKSSTK